MPESFGMGVFDLSGELRQLGPYRLLCQLATGGMGVLYLGRHPGTGRIVAIKTLLAPAGVTEEARKRFGREVKLARRVRSQHTAKVLDSDVEAERPWMAMEYVPAPSLEALTVQKGPLSHESAVRWIALGIARALKELHRQGIVHRDVKPLNILLTTDGPKVIDFGISHASDLTSTKLTLGTVAFAAPEQADGQPSAPASDIYALGVTLFYLACGKLPYPETQEPLQQLNYVRQAATNLDGLPEGLTELVGDCLAARPEDRPTAEQLVRRLAESGAQVLPSGWRAMIDQYLEEGKRLQRATDQAEAETVTRDWTSDTPGHTRRVTDPTGGSGGARRQASGNNRRGGGAAPPTPAGGTGPGGNPGSGGNSSGKIGALVVALIAAVVVASALASENSASDSTDTSSDTVPTSTDTSSPPDDDPTYDPPDPDPIEEEPEDTYDPDPTYDEPEPDPTYDAPEPDPTYDAPDPTPTLNEWGAIAVGQDGSNGRSWDYDTESAAKSGALSQCSGTNCKVVTTFHNGCGAVAYNESTRYYHGGSGDTAAEAKRDAQNNVGGGRVVTWACTTRYE
ncbi:protein kinase domain-containing protein [Streptomyces oceani]|uniref:protein kinase domain-containing protein n=1 Tax=Streptomyces oceani TaxID=1075402 RepID=UPI001112F839|nr:protein kinase [Streptomyces oceani]